MLGFGAGQAPPVIPVTIAYTATASSNANAVSYTFGSVAIGTAAANRRVVIAVGAYYGEISSMTIGGVSAVYHVGNAADRNASNVYMGEIWSAPLATGTTATIVTTFTTSIYRMGISAFALYGASATATDTAVDDDLSNPNTVAIDIVKGGLAVGIVGQGVARAATWTNMTERNEVALESGVSFSAADTNTAVADDTTLAITVNYGGGVNQQGLSVASFGPE